MLDIEFIVAILWIMSFQVHFRQRLLCPAEKRGINRYKPKIINSDCTNPDCIKLLEDNNIYYRG